MTADANPDLRDPTPEEEQCPRPHPVVLARIGVSLMPTVMPIVLARFIPVPYPLAAQLYGATAFLAIPALLGLVAAVTGRGRWWGLTAFSLSVVGSPALAFAMLLPTLIRDGAFR